MNINVVGLRDASVLPGDELAAFDGELCVGALKIIDIIMNEGYASLVTSFLSDDHSNDGFTVGHAIQVYAWNKMTGEKKVVQTELLSGKLVFIRNESVLIKINALTTGSNLMADLVQIDVFPNPCQGRITIRFSEIPKENSRIEISDISGRKLISRLVSGTSEEFNLDSFTSGLYLVKSILGSSEFVQKFIVNK